MRREQQGGAWEWVGIWVLHWDGHRHSCASHHMAIWTASHRGPATCSAGAGASSGRLAGSGGLAGCSAAAVAHALGHIVGSEPLALRLPLPPGRHLLKQPAELLQLVLWLCSGLVAPS